MKLPVEPACYTWSPGSGPQTYPSDDFVAGIVWLESFFASNPQCRIPMTRDLRAAVSRLFPYKAAASMGRIGQAQELIGLITRMVDRACVVPDFDYNGDELRAASLGLIRVSAIYLDDDVWLSWTDLLAQCVADASARSAALHAFVSLTNSCIDFDAVEHRPGPVNWVRIRRDSLPDGLVDPTAIVAMRARWRKCARSSVWEDSGHQPPVTIKRLLSRLVEDCEGVVLRFGSTYYNPCLSARCAVMGCGTTRDHVSQLDCCLSDGVVTVRGVFRTTAETSSEQTAALSYVRERLRLRCAEAGFTCE